ncbi:MAG: helix-turn-helix transcriptional regulator [Pseudomonadales bacterium]|nr:helix-turn-helix transcriptional regulator [Pseudomonadales bacterium]
MAINSLILNSAIARGLDVIGDRWALLILRDAFLGRSRFEEFRKFTGASKSTLTRRLENLVGNDLLYKQAYGEGSRSEYKLTEKGLALFGCSLLAWQWEQEWSEAKQVLPAVLYHEACNQVLCPKAICYHCHQVINVEDVQWPDTPIEIEQQLSEIKSINKQRRVRSSRLTGEEDRALATISDLIGDRWTLLMLIAFFFGLKRYDDFIKQLDVATNILAARLNLLIDVGVISKHAYQQNPPRYEYQLTEKGRALYPFVIALRQWAVDWKSDGVVVAELIHKTCGQPLVVSVVCGSCGATPESSDVHF